MRFTHSPRARAEGAVLAAFCCAYHVLPAKALRRSNLTFEFGERLCATYEAYRACFPQSNVTIEELLSLVLGIADNREVGLGNCALCGGTVLVDRLARACPTCVHCEGVIADDHNVSVNETVSEFMR